MMLAKKYNSLILELSSFITKYDELILTKSDAEFDLKWRLTQLYQEVEEEDEQKFIDISGMQGYLTTSAEKRQICNTEKHSEQNQKINQEDRSDLIINNNKTTDKSWAKSLYKRAVRRCHPDTLKSHDDTYKEELTQIYKSITESYENGCLDILMVESYKLFVRPKEVIIEQIEILEQSKKVYHDKIKEILSSQGYAWSTFSDEMKEVFLINLMKQKGVRFANKNKIKEVLKRKVSSRKIGQKPKNKLRERVKNKK